MTFDVARRKYTPGRVAPSVTGTDPLARPPLRSELDGLPEVSIRGGSRAGRDE